MTDKGKNLSKPAANRALDCAAPYTRDCMTLRSSREPDLHKIEADTPESSPSTGGGGSGVGSQSGPSVASGGATSAAVRPSPVRPKPDILPPWRVLLHNDDRNDMDYVVETIVRVVRLNRPSATRCMMEAHRKGCGQLVATHRERAEFIAEQLRSMRLVVTIEPVR